MFTSRHKLLATIIASYAIACLAVSVCLDLVTARYEAAVENAENQQLDGVLNRQIDDRIWHNHAESVSALARAIAQEPQIRHLIEADDIAALRSALPQMSRREAVTSGAIALLGVAATRADGTMLTNDGGVPFASPDMDIPKLLSGRSGVDQLKVLTRVWTSEGQPVLTVIHPVGGLRPIGYVVVHASPLKTLSNLDQQMGMAITFWSADRTKELATLSNWKPAAEAQIYRFNIDVRSPDGVVIMIADVGRDVTGRVGMMSKIRFWAFTSLVGILAAVAVGSIALILVTTRRMVSEGAYEEFKLAIEGMSHGLCMFDSEQRLIVCNQRYMQMYGLPPELAKPGLKFHEIHELRVANGIYASTSAIYLPDDHVAAGRQDRLGTKIQHLANGKVICISHRPRPGGGWIATHDDITDRLRIEAKIAHMAHHDALTDLPNRTLLLERLGEALHSRRQIDHHCAVFILDLDRFKDVNDTLGHPVGDALLRQVANRLRECVGESDTIARLGGDEFAILQSLPNGDLVSDALARRILEVISEPFDLEGHLVCIGTSIGIAVGPKDGTDPDQLLKNADLALYRAKNLGRGTHHFFEPALDELMQARRTLERELRGAIVNQEFELHYQPLVNLERDEICGFEALLRWNKPGRGRVSPADFIPLAEETGLIVQIGQWVLRQACREAKAWPDDLTIAVNVSPAQFKNRQFVSTVVAALAASGLSASRLELEITESVVLEDSDSAFATLNQLHTLGVRLALDDFGTGYSSLTSLRKFPFDKIKIDRSFVSDISDESANALAIVRSVAGLGTGLGMTTTAEGVETQHQLDHVRAMGCTEFQGYLYSPPKPAHEITQLIERTRKKKSSAA